LKLSYLTITQAATVTVVASLFAFALGSFVFPSTSPGPSPNGREGSDVDSLIGAWCDARSGDIYSAAGMTPVHPPIPGAKFGTFPPIVRLLADSIEQLYKIPAPVVLAQFALESRFGLSDLGAKNFFGHKFVVAQKFGPKPPQRAMALTREFVNESWVTIKLPFAKYSSVNECFHVHGKFLSTSSLYKKALNTVTNPTPSLPKGSELSAVRYATELGRHYATDPDYALKLITIIKRYQLAG
jgi:hypothetical protein